MLNPKHVPTNTKTIKEKLYKNYNYPATELKDTEYCDLTDKEFQNSYYEEIQ